MNSSIVKKGYIVVTAVQLTFSFIALFVSSFIWNSNDVYIQIGYKGYGWQTLIIACLIIIWLINGISLFAQLSGTNIFQEYGKLKTRFQLLIIYGFCGLIVIVAAILETWNSKLAANEGNKLLHPRFVITAVFCWLLIVSHVIMILITLFI